MIARITTAVAAVVAAAGLSAAPAAALPGQCFSSPWGGWCDSPAWPDGSFFHSEYGGFGGFSVGNNYQACHDPATNRAVPTDTDPSTSC